MNKIIKFLLLLSLGLVIAGSIGLTTAVIDYIARNAQQNVMNEIYDDNVDRVFRVQDINNPARHGTGVVVKTKSGKNVILTNGHVCDAVGETADLVNYNQKVRSTFIFKSTDSDLCLMTFPETVKVTPLELDPLGPLMNEIIYTIGFPSNHPLVLEQGNLVGPHKDVMAKVHQGQTNCLSIMLNPEGVPLCIYMQEMVLTTIRTFQGSSGSPALNKNGKLIGLVFANLNSTGYGALVYLEDIKKVLKNF